MWPFSKYWARRSSWTNRWSEEDARNELEKEIQEMIKCKKEVEGDNNMEFKAGKKIEVGYENPKTDPFGLLSFKMEMVETEECDKCSKDLTMEEAVKLGKSVRYTESEEATNIVRICKNCFHEFLEYVADHLPNNEEK